MTIVTLLQLTFKKALIWNIQNNQYDYIKIQWNHDCERPYVEKQTTQRKCPGPLPALTFRAAQQNGAINSVYLCVNTHATIEGTSIQVPSLPTICLEKNQKKKNRKIRKQVNKQGNKIKVE